MPKAQTVAEEKKTITISLEQSEELANAIAYAKAFASPTRLAIVGTLALSPTRGMSVEELCRGLSVNPTVEDGMGIEETGPTQNVVPAMIERDLRQLEDSGLIIVEQWAASKHGQEPLPLRVRFNLDYLKATAGVISTLHQLQAQAQPATERAKLDERAKTLSRFMKDGKLIALPVGLKRQTYILEEIAKAFQPNRTYTEREVDDILKVIYEYDYCTIRRFLVDSELLNREAGVYWKA